MEIKKGIGVSPGVVIGTAIVLDAEDLVVPKRHVDAAETSAEIERIRKAVAESITDLTHFRDDTQAKFGEEIARIFDVHIGLLMDPSVLRRSTKRSRRTMRPPNTPSASSCARKPSGSWRCPIATSPSESKTSTTWRSACSGTSSARNARTSPTSRA